MSKKWNEPKGRKPAKPRKYPSPKFRPEKHKRKYDYVKGHSRIIKGERVFIHGLYRKKKRK